MFAHNSGLPIIVMPCEPSRYMEGGEMPSVQSHRCRWHMIKISQWSRYEWA